MPLFTGANTLKNFSTPQGTVFSISRAVKDQSYSISFNICSRTDANVHDDAVSIYRKWILGSSFFESPLPKVHFLKVHLKAYFMFSAYFLAYRVEI